MNWWSPATKREGGWHGNPGAPSRWGEGLSLRSSAAMKYAATRTKRGQMSWCTTSQQHAISFMTCFLGVSESVWQENSDAVKHYWVKWVQIIKYLLSVILKLFLQVTKLNVCYIKMIFIKKFSVILGNPFCAQPRHFFSFSFWQRDTCLYYTICYCGVMKN